jgi:hypothetical protein
MLELDPKVPIADLASLCLSIIALIWIPQVAARFERRGAFDRKAVSDHLTPARADLLALEEALTTTDLVAARHQFVGSLRSMRTHIDHAQRIARLWKWNPELLARLDDAAMHASQLNRITTGDNPSLRLGEAHEAARALHEILLVLLRASA